MRNFSSMNGSHSMQSGLRTREWSLHILYDHTDTASESEDE